MSGVTESKLIRESDSTYVTAAGLTVGTAAVAFAVGLAALFELVTLTDSLGGLPVTSLFGALLVLLGTAVVGFGVVSRSGVVDTSAKPFAGLTATGAFAFIWFVVGGLVGSQTLGLDVVGWLPLALGVGGVAAAATVLPREDVGSTAPAGGLAVLGGLALLTGLIGPGWTWSPGWTGATFDATVVVPGVVLVTSLLVGWAAAKAYGRFGARGRQAGAYTLIYLNALAIIGVLVALVLFVVVKGFPGAFQGFEVGPGVGPATTLVLGPFSYTVVWPVDWPFVMNGVGLMVEVDGILPAIVGTVWLVVGAVVFAVPLGVGAAVFLTEYAEEGRFTQVVEIATNGLWSTPSIVFGLFGYAFLIPRFAGTKTLLSGMFVLGFMLLPLVVITSREAMLSVPDEYRDASAALGVSQWQTIRSVVLPAALPGIVTGTILGVGRIAGETAPILLVAVGGVFVPGGQAADVIGGFEFTASPPFVQNPELLQATSALPYQLYALVTAGVGGSTGIDDIQQFAWGTTLVLLVVVLSFYAVGIFTRYYFRSKLDNE